MIYWGKWLLICLLGFQLSACSKIDLSDLATTAGAATGAAVTAATGMPAAVIVTSTVAGGVAGGALVEDRADTTEVCVENPELCSKVKFWETLMDFIHWIIGGGVLLIIAAWVIPGPQTLWRKRDANQYDKSTGSDWRNERHTSHRATRKRF